MVFSIYKNLLSEYEMLNNLDHPNIIKAYGICLGDKDQPPSILIDGLAIQLNEFLEKSLTEFVLVKVIFDACSAFKYLHEKHIVHRKINPNCIWINEKYEIKISEFDFATFTDDDEMESGVGHLYYMSPELFDESDKSSVYNEKIDVYAFGKLMIYILNKGKLTVFKMIDAIKGIKPTIPETIKNTLFRDLKNICLPFEQKNRPTFSEIIIQFKKDISWTEKLFLNNSFFFISLQNHRFLF